MKSKNVVIAACIMLSASVFAGCSYFPPLTTNPVQAPAATTAAATAQETTQTAPVETTASNPAEAAIQAYADFILGKNSVSTAGCFEKDSGRYYIDLTYGTYTFDELKKALRYDSSTGSRARYVVLDCGGDGISEMAICFGNLAEGQYSAICMFAYQDGGLVMNAIIEQIRADEYRLYDSGYLRSETVTSAGINKTVLIKLENGGKCSEVFTYNEYKGPAAAGIIKHLTRSEEVSVDGYEQLPMDFFVREYISEGRVKFSIGKLSDSEDDKKLEEQLIDKLKSLGAEEISDEKMKELSAAKEYTVKEVTWTNCNEEDSTPTSSVGVAEVAGKFGITVYLNPESPEYSALGNVVTVLCSGTGTDMRFVCDSDDVTVILEKGSWDMNTDSFAAENEVFKIKTKSGTIYQFNCIAGDIFPFYRLRASKGNYNAEWLVLKTKDNNMMVINCSMKGA